MYSRSLKSLRSSPNDGVARPKIIQLVWCPKRLRCSPGWKITHRKDGFLEFPYKIWVIFDMASARVAYRSQASMCMVLSLRLLVYSNRADITDTISLVDHHSWKQTVFKRQSCNCSGKVRKPIFLRMPSIAFNTLAAGVPPSASQPATPRKLCRAHLCDHWCRLPDREHDFVARKKGGRKLLAGRDLVGQQGFKMFFFGIEHNRG